MRDPFGWQDDPDDARDVTGAVDQPVRRLSVVARTLGGVAAGVVALAVAFAGAAGFLVAVSGIVVVTAVVLLVRTPAPPPPRRRPRPGPPVENAPFQAYRQVAEQLSWAAVSRRHYDLITRPLLTALATARLADRHRVDLHTDPDAARAVVGEDVWPWIDPAREPSRDGQPPGVDPRTVSLIVGRLEQI